MKIGLYFGTFNPIHIGHLVIANYMATQKDLDQVWLVVSPQNPFKPQKSLLADYHRLNLVKIAIDDNPKLRASDIEFKLEKPSYTVKTLEVLKEQYPGNEFSIIMGEDNLRSLHKWFNYEYILNHYRIFVYPRIATLSEKIETNTNGLEFHHNVIFCNEAPMMKIEASYIRQTIRANKEVKYLLTEPVLKYVEEMNFYK